MELFYPTAAKFLRYFHLRRTNETEIKLVADKIKNLITNPLSILVSFLTCFFDRCDIFH